MKGKASANGFSESLLKIMDQKNHWAWKYFSSHQVSRDQLRTHFQQEYAVYVRDFPVFLARIHGKNPPMEVRKDLAENLYEEETGGLTVGRSHPELFLYMMEGLGFKPDEFERITLLPSSQRYRQWLDRITLDGTWIEAAAVITIFVEGSIKDRRDLNPEVTPDDTDIKQKILSHPLVKFHKVDPMYLDLVRAHHSIEGTHRIAAWKMVIEHARTATEKKKIHQAVQKSLELWLSFRDGVAKACGMKP